MRFIPDQPTSENRAVELPTIPRGARRLLLTSERELYAASFDKLAKSYVSLLPSVVISAVRPGPAAVVDCFAYLGDVFYPDK